MLLILLKIKEKANKKLMSCLKSNSKILNYICFLVKKTVNLIVIKKTVEDAHEQPIASKLFASWKSLIFAFFPIFHIYSIQNELFLIKKRRENMADFVSYTLFCKSNLTLRSFPCSYFFFSRNVKRFFMKSFNFASLSKWLN